MTTTRMTGLTPKLARMLESRPGLTTYVDDIVAELRPPAEQTGRARQSVQAAMMRLIRRDWPIEVVMPGQAWIYRPNANGAAKASTKPSPSATVLFELVGRSKSGDLIIEDENRKLYRAVEL